MQGPYVRDVSPEGAKTVYGENICGTSRFSVLNEK